KPLFQSQFRNLAREVRFESFTLGIPPSEQFHANSNVSLAEAIESALGDLAAQYGQFPQLWLKVGVAPTQNRIPLHGQNLGTQILAPQEYVQASLHVCPRLRKVLI